MGEDRYIDRKCNDGAIMACILCQISRKFAVMSNIDGFDYTNDGTVHSRGTSDQIKFGKCRLLSVHSLCLALCSMETRRLRHAELKLSLLCMGVKLCPSH